MSKQVDNYVASMEFDNSKFEKNVATSMSTLEKLKQKLNLDGASKGLEEINAAAGKVNMSGLGSGVDTVKAKFSALDVVAVTALANITNKAVDAGEKLVKSLSIDQVTEGWTKFSNKTTSVATLVAQGNAIEDVNDQLDRLNWFTDETSYNFTEMVSNIAKFTATGKGLNESVTAMEGIANWAALSGQNATTASRAMYQLSQAMGAGVMRLEDYKSIQNASMDTEEFRQKCLDAAVSLGTLQENGDGTYSSLVEGASDTSFTISQFARNLTDGMWLTSDVMMEVFTEYSSAVEGIYNATETSGKLASEIIDEVHDKADELKTDTMTDEEAINAAIKELGYTLEDGSLMFDSFGLKAFESAQKARTFTDAIDSVKDAVSTGWMNTFELIFGDAEKATELWTDLANTLYDVFAASGEVRNWILEIALNFAEPWSAIKEKLEGIGTIAEKVENVTKTVSKAAEKLEYFQNIVNKVWRGDYNNVGDNPDRFDLLEKAGYDHRVVQELVNKGNQYQLTIEDVEAAHKKFGLTLETTTEETKKTVDATNEATLAFENLTDEQLEQAGLTEEEIALYRALQKEADRLGISVSDLAKEMSENDGRTLLIDSFKNIGNMLLDIADIAKEAWKDIFNPPGAEEIAVKLYGIIKSFKEFTEKLRLTGDKEGELTKAGEKLQRTFKGIFAIVDVLTTILGGGLKIAFKVISQVLSYFHLDILDVTAAIGDALVKFHEWFESIFDVSDILDAVVPLVEKAADTIREWFNSFKASKGMQDTIKYIEEIGTSIKDWWISLKDAEDLPKTIAEGIVNFFSNIPTIISTVCSNIWSAITSSFSGFDNNPLGGFIDGLLNGLDIAGQTIAELGKILLEKVNGFLTAHGFEEISADVIAGLANGLRDGAVNAWNAAVEMAKNLVQKVKDFLGIESPSTVFAAIGGFIIAGLVLGLQNGIPDSLGAIKDVFQPMLDWVKGLDFGSILAAALSIGTIGTTYKAVGVLETLASPLEGLGEVFIGVGAVLKKSAGPIAKVIKNTAKVVKSFSKVLNAVAFDIKAEGIKKLGETLLMLVGAIIILTFFEPAELWNAVGLVAALAAVLVGLSLAMSKINDSSVGISKEGLNVKSMSTGLIGIAAAILLMAVAVKMIGSLDPDQAKQGFLGLAGMVVAIGVVIAAFGLLVKGKAAENMDKFGAMMLKLSIALILMSYVVKALGGMDQNTLIQGGIAIIAFAGIMVGLMAATKLISGSKNVDTIGSTLLKIALAIGVMAIVAKALGSMDRNELIQGGIAIVAFSGIIVGLMAATKLINGSKNVDTIGGTLLKIAVAIGVMGLVVKLLGGMDRAELIQGGLAIVAFAGIIVGLMAATKLISGSKNVDKIGTSLLAISGAIAIMALTAFMLSMISWEGFAKGTIMIAAFAGIIVGLMAATKLISGSKNVDTIGKTLMTVSGAIAILAGIAVLLGLVPTENLIKGVTVVVILSAVMAGLIAVTKLAQGCVGNIVALTVMIAVLAGAVYLLSTIDSESAITSAIILGGLMLVMTGVLAVLSLIGGKAGKALAGVIGLAALGLVLREFVWVLSSMDGLQNAQTNAIALSILAGACTLMIVALSLIGVGAIAALAGVVALAVLGLVLKEFIWVLASMDGLENAKTNAETLTTLASACVDMLGSLTLVGLVCPFALAGVIGLAALGLVLREFVWVLASMEGLENARSNSELLIHLMTTLADILVQISLLGPLALIGVIALAGLEAMMISFGLVAAAIGKLMDMCPGLQGFLDTGIPVLEQLASGLGSVIGSFITGFAGEVMTILPELGAALSGFMVGVQPFIMLASSIDASVVAGAGYLTAAILCLTVADFIAGIAQFLNGGLSFAELGVQLMAFGAAAMAFSTTIKSVDASAVEAANNVVNMILALVGTDFISKVAEKFGGSINFDSMSQSLQTFGEAVVGFSDTISGKIDVAAVEAATNAGALLVELNKSLPRSGGWVQDIIGEQDFETFATACKSFAECILSINEAVSQEGFVIQEEKIAQLVAAGTQFSELNAALPKSGGIAQDLAGEQDLAAFGVACVAFANCMIAISQAVSSDDFVVQSDKIAQLATAGTQFNELNTALPKTGGIAQDFAGEQDLGRFGAAVAAFAACMILVNQAISQEGFSVNLEGMEQIKQAGLKMNELQSALPKSGGWWQDIAGEQDIGDFGKKIKSFAEAIVDFSTSSAGLDQGAISSCLSTVNRIKSLMTSLIDMDYSGVDAFTGIGSGGIGADGPAYDIACAIAKFGDKVADIDTEAVIVAVTSAKRLKSLIASLVGLDTSGIENFKPGEIGEQMKSYGEKVAGIDTGIVSSSISSANRLKIFISGLTGLDTSGISNFKPESIGSALKAYGDSVSGTNIGAISSSISAANRLKNFISTLAGLNTSGVGSFKTAVDQLATVNIAGLVKAFSGASAKLQFAGADMINGLINGMQSKLSAVTSVSTKITTSANKAITSKASTFATAGGNLAAKLASGFSSKKGTVNSAVSSCLSSAATKIRDKYTAFYNAGSYLVTGFKNGISDNSYKAAAKAKAMAEAAEKAAREALKINSPSKVFRDIGSGVPEGFAQGIGMLGGEVKRSVGDMASTAIKSTRSAMTTVLDALNADMDTQPTIRPVVDLSDVQTGAAAVSGMFNGIQTVGVRSNLNAINATMNAKLQNGANDDIVSAINKLNAGLENNRGDTYNFGDFTYDDGSGITDAVQTLVRAARMGRRI